MKENGGCVQRICGSVGDNFYAVCSSSSGYIAVGGADRTVTIYDPRRLVNAKFWNKWNSCWGSNKGGKLGEYRKSERMNLRF